MHPASGPLPVRSRADDRRVERAAVRRPAVVADARARARRAEPARSAGSVSASKRVRQAASRMARIVQQSFAAVPDERRDASIAGATTGRPAAMYSKIFSGDQ